MDRRPELQMRLEEILGTKNVYYQPPESIKMQYDAIRYSLGGKDIKRANNMIYQTTNQYDGIIITSNPDTEIPDKLLSHFQMCSFGRPYVADNLNHFPFTLYY